MIGKKAGPRCFFREIDRYTKILYEYLSIRVSPIHPQGGTLLPPSTLPWLGGSPVFELERLGELGQSRQRHFQPDRDPAHVSPGRIDPA